MTLPKSYQTFADFEREEIRPGFRVGFSVDDLVTDSHFTADHLLEAERELFDGEEPKGSSRAGDF